MTLMMRKNFKDWSQLKEQLHITDRTKTTFKERDVWWCSIGCNVGDEMDGKSIWFNRPVLVLRKFNKNIFYGVPQIMRLLKWL